MAHLAIQEDEKQIWPSSLLTMLGLWLIQKEEYGHGLLCVHGPMLGMKIGDQLELKWKDLFERSGEMSHHVNFNDGKVKKRQVNEFFYDVTYDVYKKLNIGDSKNTYLYINSKTNKQLTTSTLNRELAKFSNEFLVEVYKNTGYYLTMKELKSNAFEIAWGRDMVFKYMLTKKAFQAVNRYMGHRQMSDTYELLGLIPNDEITLSFDMYEPKYVYDLFEKIFTDRRILKKEIKDMNLNLLYREEIEERGIQL